MSKINFFIGLLAIVLFPFHSEAVIKSNIPEKSFIQEKFGVDNLQDFLELNSVKITENTGRKLKLKEKIVLKLVHKRIKKKIKKGESFEIQQEYLTSMNNFNVGGFLLGFFLGPLGVLLAILFGGNALKSSLLGLLCLIIAIAIAIAASG